MSVETYVAARAPKPGDYWAREGRLLEYVGIDRGALLFEDAVTDAEGVGTFVWLNPRDFEKAQPPWRLVRGAREG